MIYLKGFREMGMVINPHYLNSWPELIGKYMLNFGGIELLSYQFLLIFENSETDFIKNYDRSLGARIERIFQLIKAQTNIENETKDNITELWAEAKNLSVWRNRIAHNPVLPTWKLGSDSESSPPDLLGVPDMKQFKIESFSDSISIEGLNKLIYESFRVASELNKLAEWLNKKT